MVVPALKLNQGYEIPLIGLGTWQSEPGEVGKAVKMALDIGYRHIDTATGYLNQEEIGNVLKDEFASGKVKREELFITSKIWNTFHSYEKATAAIDSMLKELQITYLDLVLIHWPMGFIEDRELFPLDKNGKMIFSDADYLDTWKAMENAVRNGKVRNVGLSNFNIKQMERVFASATIKPAVLQVEAHPYFPQNTLLDFCKKHGIVFTAYSPLANNTHMFRKEGQPNLLEDKTVMAIAAKYKKTPAQVVLRWAIQRDFVVIPKSTKRHRLEENFNIFDFKISPEDMLSINRLDRNWRILTLERDAAHPHFPFHEAA